MSVIICYYSNYLTAEKGLDSQHDKEIQEQLDAVTLGFVELE